jgi:hypothetical protein
VRWADHLVKLRIYRVDVVFATVAAHDEDIMTPCWHHDGRPARSWRRFTVTQASGQATCRSLALPAEAPLDQNFRIFINRKAHLCLFFYKIDTIFCFEIRVSDTHV